MIDKDKLRDTFEYPDGAVENGREFFRRIEQHYDFKEEEGHDLENCLEYESAKQCFEVLVGALSDAANLLRED